MVRRFSAPHLRKALCAISYRRVTPETSERRVVPPKALFDAGYVGDSRLPVDNYLLARAKGLSWDVVSLRRALGAADRQARS